MYICICIYMYTHMYECIYISETPVIYQKHNYKSATLQFLKWKSKETLKIKYIIYWEWFFHSTQISLENHSSCWLHQLLYSFWLLSRIPWVSQVYLTTHLLETAGLLQILAIMNEAVMNIYVTSFYVNMNFHFSETNAQECNCWVIW